ncbi:MAG TPA: heme exporter protein CcmB [Chitinophagales bacterium]|nr:heme exporter protein CcmB [Chitinophagales bacterium]
MLPAIYHLIKKEIQLEWRQRTALGTILVYILGSTFLIYLVFEGTTNNKTWVALFWVISLFTAINTLSRSFQKEANEQFYYWRNLVKPVSLILAKIIYNSILVTVLSVLIFGVMLLFFNQKIENKSLFLPLIICGSIGYSNLFTLLSAITARTNNAVLLAILGFPIILPLLLLIIKLTGLIDFSTTDNDIYLNFGIILLLDFITLLLSIILFPYLWKD